MSTQLKRKIEFATGIRLQLTGPAPPGIAFQCWISNYIIEKKAFET